MKKKTQLQLQPPGNGFEVDLCALTAIVLGLNYGQEVPPNEYPDRLRTGASNYYKQLNDCRDNGQASQRDLERFGEFIDELLRLKPITEEGPLAFERWL